MTRNVRVVPPVLANTNEKLCAMLRDNVTRGDYWALVDEASITIAHQRLGEPAQSMTKIPRDVFLRFVRWYLTGDANMRSGVNAMGLSRVVKDALK